MMRYVKRITFISLLVFSCDSGVDTISFLDYKVDRSISIPVDSINYSSKFQQVLEFEDSLLLFVLNRENQILIINLISAEIESVIQMPFTVPNGVG